MFDPPIKNSQTLFTPTNIISFFGFLVALATFIFKIFLRWKENRNKKILKKSYGAKFFGYDGIERATYCYIYPDCSHDDDLLEKAEIINYFKTFSERLENFDNNQEKNEAFVEYLKKNLLGKKCKILVKMVTPKNGEVYSVVDKVVKFYE